MQALSHTLMQRTLSPSSYSQCEPGFMCGLMAVFLLYSSIIFANVEVSIVGHFEAYLLNIRYGEVSLLRSKPAPQSLYLLTTAMDANRSRSLHFLLLFKLFQLSF